MTSGKKKKRIREERILRSPFSITQFRCFEYMLQDVMATAGPPAAAHGPGCKLKTNQDLKDKLSSLTGYAD